MLGWLVVNLLISRPARDTGTLYWGEGEEGRERRRSRRRRKKKKRKELKKILYIP